MEEREYIIIKKPTTSFISDTGLLRQLDDEFWKSWVYYYLLSFYKNYNSQELTNKIAEEKLKSHPRVERMIAKYIRKYLKNNQEFSSNFDIFGEATNDEDVEGNYDILIKNTFWTKSFFFECKNLDESQDLINKYVYYNVGHAIFDGGVYRYFNGKYAQGQNFGGLIGFILNGDMKIIKNKLQNKLKTKYEISPEGDLQQIVDNCIEGNDFTFSSNHVRLNSSFTLYHLLFNFY